MNAKTKNVLLIAVAVVGIIGWIFAISGLTYQQELEKLRYAEQEATKPRVAYSYYDDTARIPCIVAEGGNASSYKIYLGNLAEMDAVIEFAISARNADVSWDASTGFNQYSSKRLTVLAGTQFHAETFHVKPHSNADNLTLSTDAKPINPVEAAPYTNDPRTMTYYKDDFGNYCREI